VSSSSSTVAIGGRPSSHTQHLLKLLAGWPRRSLSRWLFAGNGEFPKLQRQLVPTAMAPRPTQRSEYLAPLEANGVAVVGITDDHYPWLLRQIPDPPFVLFYKGSLDVLARPCVAVVGARRCSFHGRVLAQRMSADLATHGVCIVSGLALGIDTAAHMGVLQAGAPTAAFLGCGLDQVYPRSNCRLAQQIVEQGGVLISEYPSGAPPLAHHFPERNRLISGAAVAVVLIEAGEKSGSLITARMALEQGREVFAAPGSPLSEVSLGCHRLIQQGAGLVICAQDVMDNLPMLKILPRSENPQGAVAVESPSHAQLSSIALSVLRRLDGYGQCLDDIASAIKRKPHDVSLAMVELELAGFVRLGGDGYIRASKI
jgi:DNA processing protein